MFTHDIGRYFFSLTGTVKRYAYLITCSISCISLGGGISEGKKLEWPSAGKKIGKASPREIFFFRKAFPREKNCRGYREEKINSFPNFPLPPPQIIIR